MYRDVENFFSMSDIRSDKLRKFARPNENMPDRMKTCQTEYKFYIVAQVISHFD